MAKSVRNINPHLFRSRGRGTAENRGRLDETRRRRQIRSWVILVIAVVAVLLGIHFLRRFGKKREIKLTSLSCPANQSVTPFRDGLLYYDGASIHHLASNGSTRWSFPAGSDVEFSAGPTHLAIWSGSQLFLVDENGKSTYNDKQDGLIQFVQVGERYAAVVTGDDTSPKLSVKELSGNQVDVEVDAYNGLMLLDAGFFGEKGEYMWTLSLDMYGTAMNTVLNTFQVGKMTTGVVSLGKDLTYAVVFENAKLRVFTTQQVYTYDYQCVPSSNETMLVYGWKLIDSEIPERGRARLLLAPTAQASGSLAISELRVLDGDSDKRYTLPGSCIGACVFEGKVFAVSGSYLYWADTSSQKFNSQQIPGLNGLELTAYYGTTSDGTMLVASGDSMYALTLPES